MTIRGKKDYTNNSWNAFYDLLHLEDSRGFLPFLFQASHLMLGASLDVWAERNGKALRPPQSFKLEMFKDQTSSETWPLEVNTSCKATPKTNHQVFHPLQHSHNTKQHKPLPATPQKTSNKKQAKKLRPSHRMSVSIVSLKLPKLPLTILRQLQAS